MARASWSKIWQRIPPSGDALGWLRSELLYNGKTISEIAKSLGFTKQWVSVFCKEHGIDIKERTALWYARRLGIPELENTEWLQSKKGLGLKRIADELGITSDVLKTQMIRLRLDPEEFKHKSQYVTVHCYICGKPLTRSVTDLKGKKRVFCSRKCLFQFLKKERRRKCAERRKKRENYVRENWQKKTDKQMAEELGVSKETVEQYRYSLRLLRPLGRPPEKRKEKPAH